MTFDLVIKNDNLTVYCSNELAEFANNFINYYNDHIEIIKDKLGIERNTKLIVALTNKEEEANFVYGKSDFSGFFNDTGAFAYINLNGKKSIDYMYKGLMHELTHHLYKFYVYGQDKERIVWVDEGIAQFISNQKEDLQNNDSYNEFLAKNLTNSDNISLNELNHNDRSFGTNNGYNLSYIAIRYLYEMNDKDEFIRIISDYDNLIKIGSSVLSSACNYYNINCKKL